MKKNLLKKVLRSTAAKLIAAFLMLSSGQANAALTIINGDFQSNVSLTACEINSKKFNALTIVCIKKD